MDTLASSEYNLPHAVALALQDSASVFGAALQRCVGQQEWLLQDKLDGVFFEEQLSSFIA